MLSLSKHVRWAVLLLLAGCAKPAAEPAGEIVACAIDGSPEFADVCSVERNGPRLVVHRPDGGFRQFEIVSDGNVTALDGAETAKSTKLADGMIEVQVEVDRYRFRIEAQGSAVKP